MTRDDLKRYEGYSNFIKYDDKKAKFKTEQILKKYDGEIVEVLGKLKGDNPINDRYIVCFNDNVIEDIITDSQLKFDYIKDPMQENNRKILSQIIKSYNLTNDEAGELVIATQNYDYEMIEYPIFRDVKSIKNLFIQEHDDKNIHIEPTLKQLKAMAQFIKETEKYYLPFSYNEYTEKIVDLILTEDASKITKLDFLNEIKESLSKNIKVYSKYQQDNPREGYEIEFISDKKKLSFIEEIIRKEKQRNKKKEVKGR